MPQMVNRSPESASPPTDRVVDVVELLARREPLRLADLARELVISTSTAHAIMTTLCERGWLERDPLSKRFSLGPAIEVIASAADAFRPLARAAHDLAARLGDELGMAASVTERAGSGILLTYFGRGDSGGSDSEGHAGLAATLPGQRIPFVAPFGPAFAAWGAPVDRQAWIEAGAQGRPDLAARLEQFLDRTRTQGYSVERMPLGLARTAQLLSDLEVDRWSEPVRDAVDAALIDVATAEFEPSDAHPEHPVTAISAPVFDERGRVTMNLGLHPFRPLTSDRVSAIADRLLEAAHAIRVDPHDR